MEAFTVHAEPSRTEPNRTEPDRAHSVVDICYNALIADGFSNIIF